MNTFLLPSYLKSFLWDICFKKTAHQLNILLCLSQWHQWLSSKSPRTSCCGWRNWWNSLEPLKYHKGTPKGQSVILHSFCRKWPWSVPGRPKLLRYEPSCLCSICISCVSTASWSSASVCHQTADGLSKLSFICTCIGKHTIQHGEMVPLEDSHPNFTPQKKMK